MRCGMNSVEKSLRKNSSILRLIRHQYPLDAAMRGRVGLNWEEESARALALPTAITITETTGNVLAWSLAATAAFVAIEVVAGFRAHSLALLSDAGHNFTDALALLLAWFGFYLQSKPADEYKTYGYHRAGVLSAFVNALDPGGALRLDSLRGHAASAPSRKPCRKA